MRTITNNHKATTSRRAKLCFLARINPARVALMLVFVASSTLVSASAAATDVTGTWNFSVDLGAGGQGTPVFALKQSGVQITGTYEGPLGKHNVTGRVTGTKIVINLKVTRDDGPVTLTYTGKIDNPNTMSGSVSVMRGTAGMTGTWRASKKQ
jgi:hypothetical protein